MTEDKTRMDRIEEKLDEIIEGGGKKKIKKFNIPIKARLGARRLKDNYAIVIKINENNQLDFIKEKIIEQTIMVDSIPRLASGKYVMNYKNKPVIIVPSWSVKPFSPSESYQESLKDGSNAAGYRLLMNRMQGEAIKLGKKIGGWGIGIGGIIIAGIVAYSLISG